MILYGYVCSNCGLKFEELLNMEYRDLPTTKECRRCGEYSVIRALRCNFNIPEGSCGNAANGYSSTHGDSENFKARAKGEKEPYPKIKK